MRSQFPTTRFIRSLGHRDSKGFMARYERCGDDYAAQVAQARRKLAGDFDTLDEPLIAYLAAAFRSHVLAREKELVWDPEGHDIHHKLAEELTAAGFKHLGAWERPGQILASHAKEALTAGLPTFRKLRATGDIVGIVDLWGAFAIEFAESLGRVIDPRQTEGMRNLCRSLNDAALAAGDGALRRLDGEDVPTPPEPVAPPRKTPENPTAARVPLLSTFDDYAAKRELASTTSYEWRRCIEKLIAYLGHDDGAKITTDDLQRWCDGLLEGGKRGAVTVKDKYLCSIKVTLAYAKSRRLISHNAAEGVEVTRPRKKGSVRPDYFRPDEAKAILTATLGPHDPGLDPLQALARRWVPWLCAYTGARVNEITQLRREDIFKEDGIWAIRITPEAGTVKDHEFREVPLHPHLLAQGFVKTMMGRPPGFLFYDPSRRKVVNEGNRYAKKQGERLAAWVRNEVGIKDPNVDPNHAWRHLFKSMSPEAMDKALADAIQGHASKEGSQGSQTYYNPPLRVKAKAIARIPRFKIKGV